MVAMTVKFTCIRTTGCKPFSSSSAHLTSCLGPSNRCFSTGRHSRQCCANMRMPSALLPTGFVLHIITNRMHSVSRVYLIVFRWKTTIYWGNGCSSGAYGGCAFDQSMYSTSSMSRTAACVYSKITQTRQWTASRRSKYRLTWTVILTWFILGISPAYTLWLVCTIVPP